jgi:D-aminopeptidase
MSRPREDGIVIGTLEPGPRNSIADVGITVGHVTVERTGVTAVVPPSLPLPAGTAVLNGAGELTGSLEIREWGLLETPVYLTATHAVGRVYDGAVSVAMAADPRVGVDEVVIPVVGECDDSWLSDARVAHVQPGDVARAVADAAADFEQGAVGAGAGMSCFDWKGGIGSSSRRAGDYIVGVLLLTNFGTRKQLRVDGVPIGQLLDEQPDAAPDPGGSCIAVVATDAPLTPARSSSPSRPRTGVPSPIATSIHCSRRRSMRPRRRCSARSGRRSTRSAARGDWCAGCRARRCSSSTVGAAGSRLRTAAARVSARRDPSPPRAG